MSVKEFNQTVIVLQNCVAEGGAEARSRKRASNLGMGSCDRTMD